MKHFCWVALMLWVSVESQSQSQLSVPESVRDLQCATCHSCDVPTRENPCLRGCPRIHMVTVHQEPEEGPDFLILSTTREGEDLYKPVYFSHKWHAEMSGMAGGCTVCHHYNPPGGILACRECHDAARMRTSLGRPDLRAAYHRQCVGCHREWAREVGCEACHALRGSDTLQSASDRGGSYERARHPKIAAPGRVVSEVDFAGGRVVTFPHGEHIGLFGLECADCHSRESCIRCHDTEREPASVLPSSADPHQACENCHAVAENCERCHGNEAKPPFDHGSRTGWPLGRFHQELPCQRCHTGGGSFVGLNRDCSSCHGEWTPETFQHRTTGLTLDAAHADLPCEVCHSDMVYREQPTCEQCHDTFTYPQRLPGSRRQNVRK